jgi:hypothetical protein
MKGLGQADDPKQPLGGHGDKETKGRLLKFKAIRTI